MKLRMRSFTWLSVLVGIVSAVGCNSGDGSEEAGDEAHLTSVTDKELFDVNDVSILFGRNAKSGELVPSIPVSEKDDKGEDLWGQAAFDDLVKFARGTGENDPQIGFFDGEDNRDNWRIVGLRFSPCGPSLTLRDPDPDTAKRMALVGTGCLLQVRMVAQPVADTASHVPQDYAAHLVYSIGNTTGKDVTDGVLALQDKMVADLREIKRLSTEAGAATTGEPLGVHPGLRIEAEKGSGKVAAAVKKWIKTYTAETSAKVSRTIAFMGIRNGFEPWVFTPGKLTDDGHWHQAFLPSFLDFDNPNAPGNKNLPMHMRLDFSGGDMVVVGKDRALKSDSSAAPSAALNTASLFTAGLSAKEQARLAFGVEQPMTATILNTDCVSCHTDSSRIVTLGIRSTADRMRVPRGITGYVANDTMQADQWNTRNFGYFGNKATVSLRTLNETILVAEILNLAAQQDKPESDRLPGPARDCTAKDDAIFDCMVHSDGCTMGSNSEFLKTCGKFLSDGTSPEPAATRELTVSQLPVQCGKVAKENVFLRVEDNLSAAVIRATDAECLSAILQGPFEGQGVAIRMPIPGTCVVSIETPTEKDGVRTARLKDEAADQLFKMLHVPVKNGHRVWESTGPNSSGDFARIDCTKTECTVTLTNDKALP